MIIFVDSWIIGVPASWIMGMKDDIDFDKRQKDINQRSKKQNV